MPNFGTLNAEWVSAFHWGKNAVAGGGTIAYIGDRGTGKTQIAVELIRVNTLLDTNPRRCLYIRAQEMFQQIRECYGNSATANERSVIAKFSKPWLLVIDEAHDRAHTPAETRLLNMVLDLRYAALFPTVFIANATPDEFRAQIGESIFDRMSETGGLCPCDWKSFRVR